MVPRGRPKFNGVRSPRLKAGWTGTGRPAAGAHGPTRAPSARHPHWERPLRDVAKFKGIPYNAAAYSGAPPKRRAMLRENVAPLWEKVSFADIAYVVSAFKAIGYPHPGPVDCGPCP